MMDELVGKGVATSDGNGLSAAKKSPPSAISEQLRNELIRILQTGDDKSDGEFTVAVAAHVEKFTVAAREILMTENLAKQDLSSLMMMRRHHMGGLGGLGGTLAYGGFGNDGLSMPMSVGIPPINNENFGVQAIRQVIDAVRTMGESPAKLVEALAVARENGLGDVAAVLETKLGVAKATGETGEDKDVLPVPSKTAHGGPIDLDLPKEAS